MYIFEKKLLVCYLPTLTLWFQMSLPKCNIMSNGGPVESIANLATGQDRGNAVTIQVSLLSGKNYIWFTPLLFPFSCPQEGRKLTTSFSWLRLHIVLRQWNWKKTCGSSKIPARMLMNPQSYMPPSTLEAWNLSWPAVTLAMLQCYLQVSQFFRMASSQGL